jgi:hypothetical protein
VHGRRNCCRQHRRSQLINTDIVASSPFIEANLQLSALKMSLLLKGFKYVTLCQSRFSRQSTEDFINDQLETLLTTIKGCLRDNRMSACDQRAKEAFAALKQIVDRLYTSPLPRKLAIRARKENKTLKRIQCQLRKNPHILITRTDKSNVPYIGLVDEFECKVKEYMSRTNAYQEITSGLCPLGDIIKTVTTMLDRLLKANAITKQQYLELKPKRNKLVLAHIYFVPKPHKVIIRI